MIMRKRYILFALLMFLLTAGCSEKESQSQQEQKPQNQTNTTNSVVLATVYGEPITEEDVDFTIARTFSTVDQLQGAEKLRHKVLQSLIAAKAMVHHVKQEADKDLLANIDSQVAAYKEELYVKEYLTQYAIPQPVTPEMVLEYYNNNPSLFGAKIVKTFELLSTTKGVNEQQANIFIDSAHSLKETSDWKTYSKDNNLEYKQSIQRQGLLEPVLNNALDQLENGETSNIIVSDGVPTLLRVININKVKAKPLAEVSHAIRQRLAPIQIKKSVKAATEELIKKADVVITK